MCSNKTSRQSLPPLNPFGTLGPNSPPFSVPAFPSPRVSRFSAPMARESPLRRSPRTSKPLNPVFNSSSNGGDHNVLRSSPAAVANGAADRSSLSPRSPIPPQDPVGSNVDLDSPLAKICGRKIHGSSIWKAKNGFGLRRSPRISDSPSHVENGDKAVAFDVFSAKNGGGVRQSSSISDWPSYVENGDKVAVFDVSSGKNGAPRRTSESPSRYGDGKFPFSGEASLMRLRTCETKTASLDIKISISGQALAESAFLKLSPSNGDLKFSLSCQAVIPGDLLRRFLCDSESPENNGDITTPLSGHACIADGGSGAESSYSKPIDSNGGFMSSFSKHKGHMGRPTKLISRSPLTESGRKRSAEHMGSPPLKKPKSDPKTLEKINGTTFFVGDPVPEEEARQRWPHHYAKPGKKTKSRSNTANEDDEDEVILDVKCHFLQANISGCIFDIGDCTYVKSENGRPSFVGKILEFFQTIRGENYFSVQWFFRADDTVMNEQATSHDKKRLFFSDLRNDNLLDCIISKVRVVQVSPSVSFKSTPTPSCYYYYDMKYSVEYSTFCTMETNESEGKSDLSSSDCSGTEHHSCTKRKPNSKQIHTTTESKGTGLSLLDLYSGCGGMSTGLCLGAQASGVNLLTRWAIDSSGAACQSLKLNHPETQVRNETTDDFFELLKEWEKLCKLYIVNVGKIDPGSRTSNINQSKIDNEEDSMIPSGEYEVLKLVDICYGDPTEEGKRGLKFKVRWKGYSPSEDTWELIEGLSNCEDRIRDFVREGYKTRILPLPGDVDVICGGPPCQGISGYNRFRNFDAPLEDDKNRQIVVFMDIVHFLKPKYVLMENVVDILRFAKGTLARYAVSRLVSLNYQARLGIMAAGCYGLPQFRMRVFLWGCQPSEKLPQFPLPTHDVILKYGPPVEFERNVVGYEEGQARHLEKALVLEDILSDLPAVTDQEMREQMPYGKQPQTEFQKYIRTPKSEMLGSIACGINGTQSVLYDHRPQQLSEDDYLRVAQIPRKKGANFRDLPGVVVGANNSAHFDTTMERVLLPSGKPLVPDYAMNLYNGKSMRPFARLWWDETVPTVLTTPNSHYQAILHPEQDRVLTIRESARLQGFPDYFKFCGTIKERYRQVGNAVAVPVSRALGYAMGLAMLKKNGENDKPLMTLPSNFFSRSFTLQQQQQQIHHISSSSSEFQE